MASRPYSRCMKQLSHADRSEVGKRKRGRPKKQPGERLTQKVFFRLTYAELLKLRELARAANVDYNECARRIVRDRLTGAGEAKHITEP